ncbi:MAG: hypothetical protein NUV54_00290 [Candidatus Taylorbacteria bacterium]|nr:hypothetical protein [Candidatus Taylorbacteria bacterium]
MQDTREYTVYTTVDGKPYRETIQAPDRKIAVKNTLLWFWKEYKGGLGPAINILTVNDPYNEVSFSETFVCSDKGNNYLDEETIIRVITESGGVLERDTKPGRKNHPRRSLKLKKRRRKFLKRIAPNIYESPSSGNLYYRMMLAPQTSKNGEVRARRVVKNEPLEARTLPNAIEEIRTRHLMKQNNDVAKRQMKSRSLKLTEHIVGVRSLSEEDLSFFEGTLRSKNVASQTPST